MTDATGHSWCAFPPAARKHIWLLLTYAAVSALLMIAAAAALKSLGPDANPVTRGLIALAPLPPFALMFVSMSRCYRMLDEMQARAQLEALGFTVVLTAIIVTGWGQLQKAGVLPAAEMAWVWPIMAFCYAICHFLVIRRYS